MTPKERLKILKNKKRLYKILLKDIKKDIKRLKEKQ